MKIAVFGDSFCAEYETPPLSFDPPLPPSWYRTLENYGHTVTTFGASASSILYSAQLLEEHANNFDFIVWAVTNPPRLSIKIDQPPYNLHFTSIESHRDADLKDIESQLKCKAAQDYLKYLSNTHEQNLIGRALVEYFLNKYSNLMVVPCFKDPLDAEFNLYDLCCWESNHYFPYTEFHDVCREYWDMRRCHLTTDNNIILGNLIAKNLSPGLFQTSYDNFVLPAGDVSIHFLKKET